MSPQLGAAQLKETNYRWNHNQQLHCHILGPEYAGHYDHQIVETIQILTYGWYPEPLYKDWRSTLDFASTGETFGLVSQRGESASIEQAADRGDGAVRVEADSEEALEEEEERKRSDDGDDDDDDEEEAEEDYEEDAEGVEEIGEAHLAFLRPSARYVCAK